MRKFNHKARAFSKLNLSYLSYCSNLAYEKESTIKKGLQKLGFDTSRDNFFFSDSETSTQAFVVGDKRKIIISFRGTKGKEDWVTDAKISKETWTDINPLGRVHRGFYSALDSIWHDINQEISTLRTNNQSLWITGHSLGGALASLAAANFELQHPHININGVYTFGQPRIGDDEFAKNYNDRLFKITFRCVNNNDVVTRLPPQFCGYGHVGKLMYFDTDGDLHSDNSLSWWARFWDRLEGRYDDLFDLSPDGVGDHSMDIYQELSEKAAS